MESNIADKHLKQVSRIRQNVEDSWNYNQNNINRFRNLKSFVFESTISRTDRDTLTEADKPIVELNIVESYISRLRGEFSKQVPEIEVRADNDTVSAKQVEVIEGYVRSIFCGSEYEHKIANAVYTDTLSGGFSVIKVVTEYEHDESMRQVIRLEKVFDPDLCGFDPLAREASKEDGIFAYQLVPKYEHEIEAEYPDIDLSQVKKNPLVKDGQFRWSYTDQGNRSDIYYIADYYEKQSTYEMMYLVSDPMNPDAEHSMWKSEYDDLIDNWTSIQEPPQILKKSRRKKTKIMRYKFIEDVLIDRPEETDYDHLPLIFVDGNSAHIKGKQITRPYIYNAVDAQRIKNLAASCMVNDLENMRQTDVLIANEAWPENAEFAEAWKNPQKAKAALVYNHFSEDGVQITPTNVFPRSQINPAFGQINEMQDGALQHILGSYDAQLGIQKQQLSGVAIVEGATQSNNAAMPYVINYMASLNQVANVIVSLLPKYYKTMRTIPVVSSDGKREYVVINNRQDQEPVMMDFYGNDLHVSLKAGPNFDVQKNRSLTTIVELMKVSESFRAMIESKGLPILVDNVDIKGREQLKQMSEKFMQEMEQKAANQKNPQEQIMQAQIQIEQQKLQLQAKKQQNDMIIAQEKLRQEQIKLAEEAMQMRTNALIRLEEAQNEADRTAAQLAISQADHQIDVADKMLGMVEKSSRIGRDNGNYNLQA
jgi:hypothetical protein